MTSKKVIKITNTFSNISVFAPKYLQAQPQFVDDMNALIKLRKRLMYKKEVKGIPDLEEYALQELLKFKNSAYGKRLLKTQYPEIRECFPKYFKSLEKL